VWFPGGCRWAHAYENTGTEDLVLISLNLPCTVKTMRCKKQFKHGRTPINIAAIRLFFVIVSWNELRAFSISIDILY